MTRWPPPARSPWSGAATPPPRWTPCACWAGSGNSAGEAVFRTMLAVPGLFDAFHFAALRPGGRLALLADSAARRQVVPRLREYLDQHPVAWPISVFSTGAAAVSRLAGRYPAMTHVVFCTDVTPHRLWVHPNVDLYLVTSGRGRGGRPAVRARTPGSWSCRAPVRPALLPGPGPGRGPRAHCRSRPGSAACCSCPAPGAWAGRRRCRGTGRRGRARPGRGRAQRPAGATALAAVAARQPRVRAIGFTDRGPRPDGRR